MQQPKNTKVIKEKKTAQKRIVVQIRMLEDEFQRFLKAMESTPFHNRCEFIRVLIDESLTARGV